MAINVAKEVSAMHRMTVKELRRKFSDVFGDETRSGNKAWLIKRIAWRMQANAEGGLSERARQKAHELACDADIRLSPPKIKTAATPAAESATTTISFADDARLPVPGTILVREYKGRSVQVRVLEKGFEFEGEVYRSLSAVAKSVTGSHINGFQFFRLQKGARP